MKKLIVFTAVLALVLLGSTGIANAGWDETTAGQIRTDDGDSIVALKGGYWNPVMQSACDEANPAFTFRDAYGTGMYYYDLDNVVGFSIDGVRRLTVGDDYITAFKSGYWNPVMQSAADGANPAFTFRDAEDTGMYLAGANTVGLTDNVLVTGDISVGANAVSVLAMEARITALEDIINDLPRGLRVIDRNRDGK